MSTQIQLRKGSTANTAGFTGALAEVTVDTTKSTAVVHDGATAGGHPLLREDMSNVTAATGRAALGLGNAATATLGTAAGQVPTADQVAGLVSSVTNVGGSARNLVVTNSGHTATITADEIILENATGQYMVSKAVNQAINYGASGAGGLDTGTIAASTWYYHWLVYNPITATLAALGSLSSTAPTLPSGYTFKARVGAEQTNASANLCPSIQVGRTLQRQDPLIYVMASGPATWPAAVAVRPAWVPPTATKLIVAVWMNNNGLYISPNSSYEMMALQGIANQSAFPLTLILESGSIYWGVNSSGGVLYLIGWEDSL